MQPVKLQAVRSAAGARSISPISVLSYPYWNKAELRDQSKASNQATRGCSARRQMRCAVVQPAVEHGHAHKTKAGDNTHPGKNSHDAEPLIPPMRSGSTEKAVCATTGKKISPPSQTLGKEAVRKRRNDMADDYYDSGRSAIQRKLKREPGTCN